jgi:hypothetical protein
MLTVAGGLLAQERATVDRDAEMKERRRMPTL